MSVRNIEKLNLELKETNKAKSGSPVMDLKKNQMVKKKGGLYGKQKLNPTRLEE